jgi:hypothetical protein
MVEAEAVATDARQAKPPWSWAAIVSVPLGLMMCFSWGTLAIVAGLVGLWQTRGRRRRGRKQAAYGLVMGCLSLLFAVYAFPATFYVPPNREHDRQFQVFLDDVATGRWQQAQANPLCQPTGPFHMAASASQGAAEEWSISAMPAAQFEAWGKYFRAKHGRGRILFAHHFSAAGDTTSAYTVWFERAPARQCWLVHPDDEPDRRHWSFLFGYETPGWMRPGESALHLAARFDEPDVAEGLIRQGEDVNALDVGGNTPLDVAGSWQRAKAGPAPADPRVRQVLLQHGGRHART